ncbi:hypothetical protein CONCODRAFT_13980 [Conidiobolus coronatus NRRL 28638]|uniref:Amine oxidase domain-containing protein n=1 Tax=Conidiobolus coronatus (strain ATCC 28846 / CBS 209.66 / NRRL 28638) TaxID=796925 RepID=A0A137NPU4_CONC2|nr:hypothetical protein CONCODRAFT_13980 [Conidiobolus coronatus NRRL 28638]|eukprot:KXN64756.1 hypothetical protein CONCODRAFT_13980 [Conidiobolus coronatus NRRL 28638]
MDQIPFALAKDLDITYNAQVSNIVRYKNSVKISYSTKSGIQIQKCSSAILAFTPLLNQLKNMISDLSEEEKDVLGQVKVHKYATIANYAPTMKYFVYAPLLPPPFPPNMDNGIPALIVNQTRGAAVSYHSNRGSFDAGPTDEELAHYKSQNHKFFPKLFNSKDTKTNIYIKGYEYFPHVTTESLQDGFYDKFNSIQGKNNIYYATPLLSFEVIEHSIRTAEYIVESFF